jgi:hypothetical protein
MKTTEVVKEILEAIQEQAKRAKDNVASAETINALVNAYKELRHYG